MPELSLQPLPFEEALEFFRAKGYAISPNSWRDVWGAQHVQAFTVARVTAMDVLEDIREAVDRAIEEGVTFNRFQAGLSETLARKGWLAAPGLEPTAPTPLKPWRLRTLFRTNLQGAYQGGRYRQMLEVAQRRPYWLYDAVEDSQARPTHFAHDGKVYRFDHPFWETWYPLNGFNCRCTVRTLSARQMLRRGLEEETRGTDLRPDPGFEFNPGMVRWRPDLSRYTPPARRILQGRQVEHPTAMPALAERLTRQRDGMRETGMRTSTRPIRIREDRTTEDNAWARYSTGEIGMRSDLYRRVRAALRKGKAQSASEVDAFKSLVHEFGHHLGHPIGHPRYETDLAYKAVTQTVNDLWARHHTPQVLGSLQIQYSAREAARLVDYHPTGYQPWVERFRMVLDAAGLDEAAQKEFVNTLNLTVPTEEMSERIWAELRKWKPDLRPRGDFGEVLTKTDRYRSLLAEFARWD